MRSLPKITLGQRAGVYLFVGVLLSGIIYWQEISPIQTRINKLLEEGQRQAQLVANVRALARQEDYELYATGQQAQLKTLQECLPDKIALEEQVSQYYSLAKSEGVVLQRLQLPPASDKKEQVIKLQLKAQGPYYGIVNFIRDLEGSGHYLTLEQLRLQGEKDNLVVLSAQLVLPQCEKTNSRD